MIRLMPSSDSASLDSLSAAEAPALVGMPVSRVAELAAANAALAAENHIMTVRRVSASPPPSCSMPTIMPIHTNAAALSYRRHAAAAASRFESLAGGPSSRGRACASPSASAATVASLPIQAPDLSRNRCGRAGLPTQLPLGAAKRVRVILKGSDLAGVEAAAVEMKDRFSARFAVMGRRMGPNRQALRISAGLIADLDATMDAEGIRQ